MRATLISVSGGRIASSSPPKLRQAFGCTTGCGRRSERAALRLAQRQHPQSEQQAGNADREEGGLPADQAERRLGGVGEGGVPAAADQAADRQAEAAADIEAGRIDGERRRPLLLREIIRDHRISGRRRARLADADADPRGGEHAEECRRSPTASSSTTTGRGRWRSAGRGTSCRQAGRAGSRTKRRRRRRRCRRESRSGRRSRWRSRLMSWARIEMICRSMKLTT